MEEKMRKVKLSLSLLLMAVGLCVMLFVLSACDLTNMPNNPENTTDSGTGCDHEWKDASCTDPQTCTKCGETRGEERGHNWKDATCKSPKKCSVCKKTKGEKLEHAYVEVESTPASCTDSGSIEYVCENCEETNVETYVLTEQDANEVYELAKNSVGEILTYDSKGAEYALGSCFVYSEDGKIVTNYHVIDGAYSATVTLNEEEYEVKKVLAYDKTIDLAVLQIDADELTILPLCDKSHGVGKSVYAIGSSQGLTSTFSRGIITQEDRVIEDVTYVQHDAAISSGNSGGPLVNAYGEIIGINTWTVQDSQNLNFAVAVSELENLEYGNSLTLSALAEKEAGIYLKLKNHLIKKGEYDRTEKTYTLELGESTVSSQTWARAAIYNVENEQVEIMVANENGDLFVLIVDATSEDTYIWGFTNINDMSIMAGTVYAPDFEADTLLTYTESEIEGTTAIRNARKQASSMLAYLCKNWSRDFTGSGVSLDDAGFTSY